MISCSIFCILLESTCAIFWSFLFLLASFQLASMASKISSVVFCFFPNSWIYPCILNMLLTKVSCKCLAIPFHARRFCSMLDAKKWDNIFISSSYSLSIVETTGNIPSNMEIISFLKISFHVSSFLQSSLFPESWQISSIYPATGSSLYSGGMGFPSM